MKDLCNVILWIIYESWHSGSRQQVTIERAAALKGISGDRWQARQMDSVSLRAGCTCSSAAIVLSQGTLLLKCWSIYPSRPPLHPSLQVGFVFGWFCGWWCWSQAGWKHVPSCACVTLRLWRSAASPRTSPSCRLACRTTRSGFSCRITASRSSAQTPLASRRR